MEIKLRANQKIKDVNGNVYLTEANDTVLSENKLVEHEELYGTEDQGNEWVKAYINNETYWFYAYSDKTHLMQGYDYKDQGFDNYIKKANPAVLHKNQIKNPTVRNNIEHWLYYGEDKKPIAGQELTNVIYE